jgi:hypothetical protein
LIYIRDYLPEPVVTVETTDNLLWCHYRLARGSTIPLAIRVYVFGGPMIRPIVTLSNDVFNSAWNTVTVQTNGRCRNQGYTGHNQHSWTNGDS